MCRQIMCILILAILIIAITGCATRRQYIIKNDMTAEELKDAGKVFVTLDDGSTLEFSKVEMEGDVLKGTTDAGEIKELNIQYIKSMWIKKHHASLGTAFLSGVALLLILLVIPG